MQPIGIELPCTLEEALLLDAEERELLGLGDVLIEPTQMRRLSLTWAWLRGLAPDSREGLEARELVMGDVPVLVALAQPATDFVDWFRRQDWEEWSETEQTGSECWAWGVLHRARAAIAALGPLSSQVALRSV